MGSGHRFSVTLTGGSPWGFRLFGGESIPLQIAKVRKKSKADQLGMKEDDVILSINGVSMAGKSHEDAMYIVDNAKDSITFEISRSGTTNAGNPTPVVNGYSSLQANDRNPTELRVSPVPFGQRRSPSPYQQGDNRMNIPSPNLRASPVANKRSPSPYQPRVTESTYTNRIGDTTTHVQTRQFQSSTPDGRQSKTVFQQRQVVTQEPNFNLNQVITPSNPHVWHPVSAHKENISPTKVPHFTVRNIKETISSTPSLKFKTAPPVPPKPLQERKQFNKNVHEFDMHDRQYIPDPCMYHHDYHFPEVKVVDDDDEIIDTHPHEDEFHHHHHHLPVFAPKVEICYEDFVNERDRYYDERGYDRSSLPPLELVRLHSLPDSEATGPGTPDTESTGVTSRKKKMYSDSAFFDNPEANYPTIEEQMELCKKIAQSLTSAANRKARGAKMFAKRKRKSAKWVHELGRFASSSTGDIADLHDLDTEFFVDEGGFRPLFSFRIPNIKNRLAIPDPEANKMSLSQDEFERLRLNKKRCDHRVVSPNTCHSLVADLQSPKNRGAKLFQKRQAKSEKWVIDESNARRPDVLPHTRLEGMISPKPTMSPWEAAMENPLGNVEGAFNHISEREHLQRVNKNLQNVRQDPFSPQPVSVPYNTSARSKTRLQNDYELEILQGEDFNRKARGWRPMGQSSERTKTKSTEENFQPPNFRQEPPPAPPLPTKQDNYNRKIRAWNTGPQETSSRKTEKSVKRVSSTSQNNYGTYPGRNQKKINNNYNYQMSSSEIPGSDL